MVYWLGYFVAFWGFRGVGLGLLLGVRLVSFLRWFGFAWWLGSRRFVVCCVVVLFMVVCLGLDLVCLHG